jgi:hypothetical protein
MVKTMTIEFEPRPLEDHPNFIKTVRMYRQERDLTFVEAKELAIREFEKRGWSHPFKSKSAEPIAVREFGR